MYMLHMRSCILLKTLQIGKFLRIYNTITYLWDSIGRLWRITFFNIKFWEMKDVGLSTAKNIVGAGPIARKQELGTGGWRPGKSPFSLI